MKKNSLMVQLLVKIGLFLGMVAVIILLFGSYLVKVKIEAYQEEQINNTTSIVVGAMDSTQKSAETIEHMIEKKLYAASQGMMGELRGKPIEEITMGELKKLAERWDVQEISLWQRVGDDIVVTQSSDITQLNMSSKNWGYWFTAFDQLMSGKPVTVKEGYAMDNYWVGPISRAERFDHIYYKFAYYYDGTTDFMINPFIEDEEIYKQTFQAGPTQMIDKIITENVDIAEVAVINVSAWLKGDDNDVVEPNTDLPVLYGSHEYVLDDDETLIQKAQQENEVQSVSFEENGVSYKKIYSPLPNDRVIVTVLNLTRQKQVENQFVLLFLGALIVSSVVLFLTIKWITKRQLRPLQDIVQHIQGMANGDLSQTLTINEKNELDGLAEQINKMTQSFDQLITGVKEQSHSLVIASHLLSQQVYSSIKTMRETSTTMTAESKNILIETSICLEKLQQLCEVLKTQEIETVYPNEKNRETVLHFTATLTEMRDNVLELEQMVGHHSHQVTDMTLMFYDTLWELNEALNKMDHLSSQLNQKIKFFKVKDER